MHEISRWLAISLICVVAVACGRGQQTAAPAMAPTDPPTAEPTAAPAAAATVAAETTAADAQPAAAVADDTASTRDVWLTSWMRNETGETSSIFSGMAVNVTAVRTAMIDGKEYQCITASGIPNYETVITQNIVDSLNGRPRAENEFGTGQTTATVGQVIGFGESVGYDPAFGCAAGQEGYGYWPPGPTCPTDQAKEQCFPLAPEPTTELCETGLTSMGTWVNGVAIFNWQDGQSYNGERVWENEAFHFEFYDLDICPGHSAMGDYHHHSNPVCLGEQLNDTGTGHSPIYGFATDGYPIYGPWHDSGVLANSCWKTRDYDDPASSTGCGAVGERSCLLVDQYDITQGTTPAASAGPNTNDDVESLSGNVFVATAGYYFQDYYYDASCTAQGIAYMDEHNGHEHDGLGYHYHVTVEEAADGSLVDVFPFYAGPAYAGVLQENAIAFCSTGDGPGGPPGGGGPGGPPRGGGPGNGGPPNFAIVAAELGITEQEFMAALGPPPPNLEATADALGITLAELQAAFDAAGLQVGRP